MVRIGWRLLIAYAATITVVAVWLGCRMFVLQQFVVRRQIKPLGIGLEDASFEDILIETGLDRNLMVGPAEAVVVSLAGLPVIRVAGIAAFTFIGCLAFLTLRQKTQKRPAPTLTQE